MSKSEMSRFIAAVSADEGLRTLAQNKSTDLSAVASFAQSKGFDIKVDDVEDHIRTQRANLTEQDLHSVTGGAKSGVGSEVIFPPGIVIPVVIQR